MKDFKIMGLTHVHVWRSTYHEHEGRMLREYLRCDGCDAEDVQDTPPPPPKPPVRIRQGRRA